MWILLKKIIEEGASKLLPITGKTMERAKEVVGVRGRVLVLLSLYVMFHH